MRAAGQNRARVPPRPTGGVAREVPRAVSGDTIASMCSNVRVLTAAIAGYLVGGLTGHVLASWLLMLAAGGAMFLWSRARERSGGAASCAMLRARRSQRSAGSGSDAPLPAALDVVDGRRDALVSAGGEK